jgi:hypothetical protein
LSYRSPYHILHYFGTLDLVEDPELRRLQKKFIAEFNLSGKPFLIVNGKEYSKHDVLQILDESRVLQPDNMHRAIFNQAGALSFFENPKADIDIKSIQVFMSKETAASYHKELQELLLRALQERTKHLLSQFCYGSYLEQDILPHYLQAYQQEGLNLTVKQHIVDLIRFLSSWHDHKIHSDELEAKLKEDLDFLMTGDFIDFMDSLSEDFEEHEQVLYKAFVYFTDYCIRHYNLSPGFYYTLIDQLLNLRGLTKESRSMLNYYLYEVEMKEQKERGLLQDVVREPGEDVQPLVNPVESVETTEERKTQLRKNMAREFWFARIMKGTGITMLILMVTGGILHPFYKLSMTILLLALYLLFVLLGLWAVKGLFIKNK